MSVSLSPIYNGYQSFLATGLPNSGGYLYTYAAGTSTPQATFTTSAGNIQNANPMQFNAGGYPPSAIWLTDGQAYKFVITDALGNNVQIFDNIEGSWTTGNLFAAINGSASENFTANALSASTVYSSGLASCASGLNTSGALNASGPANFSGLTSLSNITSAASGSTQPPQIKQTLGQGASGIVDHGSAFGLNDRDLSTPYTNSGASPRWVKISYSASVAAGNGMLLTWTVGGVDKGFASVYNTGASSFTLGVTDSMIVPPGSTYEVSINNGSTPVTGVPNFWLEY